MPLYGPASRSTIQTAARVLGLCSLAMVNLAGHPPETKDDHMQTLIKTSLAAALGLAAITPAAADDTPILVESAAAMDEWRTDVSRSLDRRLRNIDQLDPARPRSGIVQLRFTLDEDGRAENLEVVRSSTNYRAEKIATRAVRGLTKLDQAPVADVGSRTFQANVIFARTFEELDELKAKLAKLETARLALADEEEDVILLGG
jgi:TonB family protein